MSSVSLLVTAEQKTAPDAQSEKRQELVLHTTEKNHSTEVNNRQGVTNQKQPETQENGTSLHPART